MQEASRAALFYRKSIYLGIILFKVFLLLLVPPRIEAAGGRQINTQTADGIDIWQQEFDVSDIKPGKYNVIIRAKDAAGNVGVSGPFNLRVDPKAGLPVARVVYPEENAVMRGDITLVGVASGRYGVKQVLLRLDDEPYHPVEGIEYWSQSLEIRRLSEGRHTVYAKAIDEKDLEGPETKVSFIVDREPPVIELSNHKTGDLVSGNLTISGRADDPNGINNVSWSTDGADWKALSLKTKKGESGVGFSFPLRTKNLDDGPVVCYIRALNKTGYSITKPYLFFVVNEAPKLEILSPERDENVYGDVQITGRVVTGVGLEKFYYEWAGETVDIPLHPGDPFWTVTFPVSLASNRGVPFRVTAVDKGKNVTTLTQRLQDTRKQKGPAMIFDWPDARILNALPPDGAIYGQIAPGFFPSSIIMEGAVEEIPAGPGFRIPPELIPYGRSTLRLWAKADDDTLGPAFTLRVNKPAAPPSPDGSGQPVLLMSDVQITSPTENSYFGNSFDLEGTVSGGARLEYRLSPEDNWRPIPVSAEGSFSTGISLSGYDDGPVHMELRTIRGGMEYYPVYYPVNKYSIRPVIDFIVPQLDQGPIHGTLTVSGTVSYFVPLKEMSYSIDGSDYIPLKFIAKYGKAWFNYFCDFSALQSSGNKLVIRAEDIAGNVVEQSPSFTFDDSGDKPVAILNSPLDGEVVTADFEISGLAFDDDGIDGVYWRLLNPENPKSTVEETLEAGADVEFRKLSTAQSFEIEMPFSNVKDGENIVEVYAEDIYGVKGETIRRVIKVSTEAPLTVVSEPAIDVYNRLNIEIKGTAFDLNDISEVLVSMDNGNSYQRADIENKHDGNCDWNLSINTKAYNDGVLSALIRTVDNYGITTFSNALVNIDNTPPEISLGLPNNGDIAGTILSVTGQAYDNQTLKSLSMQLVNINDASQEISYDMQPDFVIMEQVDVSALSNGDYYIKLNAVDLAGNETAVTRDIRISREKDATEVALINPMPGIDHSGPLNISGKVTGAIIPDQVTLTVNGNYFSSVDVDRYGVFSYEYPEERMRNETVIFAASFNNPDGETISSYENEVKLNPYGPVIAVDSHKDGDVVSHRPWISGRAFITIPPEEEETLSKKQKGELAVTKVQISLDNGRSFQNVRGNEKWKYRLETGELVAGPLPLVIKADFADGRSAVRRIILTVDTTAPTVSTIGPAENSTHRDSILVYGFANDEFDMDSVEVSLRPGDKAGYSVPQFIQGFYLDSNFLGATTYSVGFGLSFFDNNVKIQAQAGQAPPGRFSGAVVGVKLIANILYLPFAYFFGPDWECFSMSFAMGANFSWFSMEPDETSLFMGALLAQWEFARLDMSYFFPKWQYFKSLSLYLEPIFWFASSDVASGAIFRLAVGARISLF